MARRAVLARERADMPDGLVKVIIIGCVGFFFGAAIIGWVYG